MRERPDLKTITDDKLLRGLFAVLRRTRHDEADLVAHIAEIDARELYARQAAPSMFAWCTKVLHLSEAEAYLRIAVARASRRHPVLLVMLGDGRLHLSGIERLAPHLTEENRDELLKRAVHKSKRQIEQLVAELAPRPARPTRMRKLPARRTPHATGGSAAGSELPPAGVEAVEGGLVVDRVASVVPELRPAGVTAPPTSGPRPTRAPEAIGPARFRLQFDLDAEFRDDLERLQALTRTVLGRRRSLGSAWPRQTRERNRATSRRR